MDELKSEQMPKNIEAEQALLGAVLANNKTFEKVSEFLDESLKSFAENPQPIFERAVEMSGGKLSLETIKAYYPHLIFKMSNDDFKTSFDFAK